MGVKKNLAPPLSQWQDGYINGAGGIDAFNPNGELYSPYVRVDAGRVYKFSYTMSAIPANTYWASICFYDESYTRVGNRIAPGTSNTLYDVFGEAPNGAKYMRMSFRSYGIATSVSLVESRLPAE